MTRRSLLSLICVSAAGASLLGCGSAAKDSTMSNTSGSQGGSANMTTGGSTATGNGGTAVGMMGSGGTTAMAGNGGTMANPSGGMPGNTNGGMTSTGGTMANNGGMSTGGVMAMGGDTSTGGMMAQGGSPSGGAGNVADDCGTPAPMPISTFIQAAPARYNHMTGGHAAAVDLRAPTIVGKLIVDFEVDAGGIYGFGVNRGFHTMAIPIFHCQVDQGCPFGSGSGTFNSDCRWNTWDGMPHGDQNNVSAANSISGMIKAALVDLSTSGAGEGWDYFLDANGDVRWSDVGFTGYSHGAQTAALVAVKQCVYRAVSRSGPRDNGCGNGTMAGDYDSATHMWPTAPYDPNCKTGAGGCVSDWILETPASPMSHFYSFAGKQDGQFGDDQYTMDHLGGGFLGEPTKVPANPPGDSHRFYDDTGHGGFDDSAYWPALQKAWGVPDDDMAYGAGL